MQYCQAGVGKWDILVKDFGLIMFQNFKIQKWKNWQQRFGPTYSPQSNGSNKRNHHSVDQVIKKIIEEEEKLDLQTARVMSIWIHNTNMTIKGYSPLQFVTGKAVNIQGVINGNMADSMYDSENMKKIMTRHYEIEKKFNEIEYSTKLERAIKLNVGKINNKKYLENQKVFYQSKNEKAWKGPATVMNH